MSNDQFDSKRVFVGEIDGKYISLFLKSSRHNISTGIRENVFSFDLRIHVPNIINFFLFQQQFP